MNSFFSTIFSPRKAEEASPREESHGVADKPPRRRKMYLRKGKGPSGRALSRPSNAPEMQNAGSHIFLSRREISGVGIAWL
jgi:hypothetical protein